VPFALPVPLRLWFSGVAVGAGFSGGFVAEGAGGGGVSGTTLRVGSGNAGALRLLLPFELRVLVGVRIRRRTASSIASGETPHSHSDLHSHSRRSNRSTRR
jgi:hypothetical protein